MIKITIAADEAKKLSRSLQDFQVCDPQGSVIATVRRELTPEFIAELKRRSAEPGPRYSGEQVREMLQSLQETWDGEGPFGEERKDEILKNLHAKWGQ